MSAILLDWLMYSTDTLLPFSKGLTDKAGFAAHAVNHDQQ